MRLFLSVVLAGLALATVSRAAEPTACSDFYAFANAGRTAPEGGAFAQLAADSAARQHALLQRAASDPQDDVDEALGRFYAAARDRAAMDAAGTTPIKPFLDRIAAAKKARDVAEVIAFSHANGLPVLFRFDAGADLTRPRHAVVYARQGGLALPDRDYYLRDDPDTQALRGEYRAYIERLLALTGSAAQDAAAEAGRVLDMETRLARASLSVSQLEDPANSWLPAEFDDVRRRYPNLDLRAFVRAQDLRSVQALSLAHVSFFVEANALMETLPTSTWRAYLRFHVAHAMAPHLSQPFRDAHEALFGRVLAGRETPRDADAAALAYTDDALGTLLGTRFAATQMDPPARRVAIDIAESLRTALRRRIDAADWLGEAAREAAIAKLDAMTIQIGGSNDFPVDGLELDEKRHAANVLAANVWKRRLAFGKLGEQFEMPAAPAHRVQMFYDPVYNRLVATAAMLRPPLLDAAGDTAANHGAFGALLARELGRGFDAQGSRFALDGTRQPWWTPADYQAFTERTKRLADQYAGYDALHGLHVDGRRTFLSNVADLAGLEIAWDAFAAHDTAQNETEAADGATPAQRFFLAWARVWHRDYDDRELQAALLTDVHAPARYRVNGPLANSVAFAQTFDCEAGAGMLRADADRVQVWR